jgi:Zn-dependent protease
MPTRQGSIRLFRLAGIDVFLHWSWFLVAVYAVNSRAGLYTSFLWNVLEYLALFAIVLMHEFGHALACRQVGGTANQIVLWPLGGVAYVDPPQRPGAMLWSLAAGPLVNVVLLPIFSVLVLVGQATGWQRALPNVQELLVAVWGINLGLLVFNLLPIYPLDGGQILRALLWFVMGRARSLLIASFVGFGGVIGLIVLAVAMHSPWIGIVSGFILLNCWGALRQAQALGRADRVPRRAGWACPSCRTAPPAGAYWACGSCRQPFDLFAAQGICPHCGAQFQGVNCLDCGKPGTLAEWLVPNDAPPRL